MYAQCKREFYKIEDIRSKIMEHIAISILFILGLLVLGLLGYALVVAMGNNSRKHRIRLREKQASIALKQRLA